jgi:DNA-binding MarR family transcriptional regulator
VSTGNGPGPELTTRLGYLLKHARDRLADLTGPALAPYGIDGRQLAVLLVLAGGEPASQHEAAQRLGIDRTTMVALLDGLEAKGLVARHPAAGDRRKNVVELTPGGRDTLRAATRASDEAESRFLAPLTTADGERLKEVLRAVTRGEDEP